MTQIAARPVTPWTVGIIADGAFKVLLAAVYVVGSAPLGRLLGVPVWLMVVAGVTLLIGGGIEIGYVRSRSMRTYTRLMVAYDSGWVLTALAGVLMAWQGGTAGGEVWIGYQAAAPVVFAALLAAATSTQTASDLKSRSECAG
ncbi:hypothetical protein [Streptomyces xylophagus]|uniref:hypothetical protein n=1 Tax=Streptomyces xylophagus TaxID=285514 RepID=UPI00068DD20F|nr:hypothetical protein [Streptomyces xylophagus]